MNLSKFFNQTAVYWGNPAPDGYGGFSYAAPVEVAVRWTDKQEIFKTAGATADGIEEKLSQVVVLAETDFDIDGRMYLGSLTDLSSSQDPDIDDALTVKGFTKIPDKTATQFLRKAWLQ